MIWPDGSEGTKELRIPVAQPDGTFISESVPVIPVAQREAEVERLRAEAGADQPDPSASGADSSPATYQRPPESFSPKEKSLLIARLARGKSAFPKRAAEEEPVVEKLMLLLDSPPDRALLGELADELEELANEAQRTAGVPEESAAYRDAATLLRKHQEEAAQ